MRQLWESPLTQRALDITIWPQDIEEKWPAPYPAGIHCQVKLDDPHENIMKELDREITKTMQGFEAITQGLKDETGEDYGSLHSRIMNYRDIIAIALNAYSRMTDTDMQEDWQVGIPDYLLKQLEGKNPEAAIRRITKQGYVKQVFHAPADTSYNEDLIRHQENKWRSLIKELDELVISHGYDVKEMRYQVVTAFVNMLRQATNNTGWLHDIWPEERKILTDCSEHQAAVERFAEKAELEAKMRNEKYYEDMTAVNEIIRPFLVLTLKDYDPLDLGSMAGIPMKSVVGLIAAVRLILTDTAVPLDRDFAIGMILNRAIFFEELMKEARKYEKKNPTKPIEVSGGFTISPKGLGTSKTVH